MRSQVGASPRYLLSESSHPVAEVIASSTREILADGRSAILVPAGDPGALAVGLETLANDAPLRARLGRQALEDVRARFPIAAAAEELVGAWRETLAEVDSSS